MTFPVVVSTTQYARWLGLYDENISFPKMTEGGWQIRLVINDVYSPEADRNESQYECEWSTSVSRMCTAKEGGYNGKKTAWNQNGYEETIVTMETEEV